MEPYKQISLPHGFRIDIYPDDDAENPRRTCDNASTVAIHPRCKYDIGDKDGWGKLEEAIRKSADYNEDWNQDEGLEFDSMRDVEEMLDRCSDIHYLPIYLYDHSGVTISTSEFGCKWDSYKAGFIFITDKVANEWMTFDDKSSREEQLAICLDIDIKILDQYCTGDVFGYQLINPDGEEVDSCWGFFGEEECENQARDNVEYYTKAWLSKLEGELF